MLRTKERPLPEGRLQPSEALGFGVAITASGLIYLALLVNPLSGLVTAVSVGSHLISVYATRRRPPYAS